MDLLCDNVPECDNATKFLSSENEIRPRDAIRCRECGYRWNILIIQSYSVDKSILDELVQDHVQEEDKEAHCV